MLGEGGRRWCDFEEVLTMLEAGLQEEEGFTKASDVRFDSAGSVLYD